LKEGVSNPGLRTGSGKEKFLGATREKRIIGSKATSRSLLDTYYEQVQFMNVRLSEKRAKDNLEWRVRREESKLTDAIWGIKGGGRLAPLRELGKRRRRVLEVGRARRKSRGAFIRPSDSEKIPKGQRKAREIGDSLGVWGEGKKNENLLKKETMKEEALFRRERVQRN